MCLCAGSWTITAATTIASQENVAERTGRASEMLFIRIGWESEVVDWPRCAKPDRSQIGPQASTELLLRLGRGSMIERLHRLVEGVFK